MSRERDLVREANAIIRRMDNKLKSPPTSATQGCVCPVGAEATCQGPLCPRKKWIVT